MKNKLFILFCIVALMPLTSYALDHDSYEKLCEGQLKHEVNPVSPPDIGFLEDLTFGLPFTGRDNTDWFCFNPWFKSKWSGVKFSCFWANSSACAENTTVCILGTKAAIHHNEKKLVYETDGKMYQGTVDELSTGLKVYGYHGVVLGYRSCAVSKNGSWAYYAPSYKEDCTSTKWKKNASINKNKMVMVWGNKAILEEGNKLPKEYYIIHNSKPLDPGICIGYYCEDSRGDYVEPCDDGTCGPCKPK